MLSKLYRKPVIFFLFFISCTKPSPPSRQVTTDIQRSEPIETQETIYPHTEKFRDTRLHGLQYYKFSDKCRICHGDDLGGGKINKSCAKCHSIFPHSKAFLPAMEGTPSLHGTEFLMDQNQCKLCHGFDYLGGNSTFSCKKCHSYPHEPLWALPKNHGEKYLESLKTKLAAPCLNCHGETASFKDRHPQHFTSCSTCHVLIPHDESFSFEGGHSAVAQTYEGKCTRCHTNLKRLMPSMEEEGCFTCHDKDKRPIMKWQKPESE